MRSTPVWILMLALLLLLPASTLGYLVTLGGSAEDLEIPEGPDKECIVCHLEVTPGIVQQYLRGAMGAPGIQNEDVAASLGGMDRVPCTVCHGSQHTSAEDWMEARLPDYSVCSACHEDQVNQFLSGKHSLAWRAMMALPMVQQMPKEQVLFGCGGCHKIGVKEPEELLELGLDRPYGIGATCDQCHTRHAFSTYEARQPEACAKCHMGFDHPQWEMWSMSKHGNIYFANKDKYPFDVSLKYIEPSDYPGPTCQLCHMPKGNHSVLTPWGFVALVAFEGRPEGLELVEDPEWEAAKVEVLKALRVLDPEGNPTPILDAVVQLRVVRVTPEEFFQARERLLEVCSGCHSRDFALNYLKAADRVIRESTIQLAEAVKAIAEARLEGVIPPRAEEPDNPYPFLLNFYEEPSGLDREAWLIFLEYRMRAFQGMFHVNPDYTHWYGWSEIRRALGDIHEEIELHRTILKTGETASDTAENLQDALTRLGDLESRVSSVEGKLTQVDPRLTNIEDRVQGLEDSYTTLEEIVDTAKDTASKAVSRAQIALLLGLIALIVSIAGLMLRRS